MISNYIKAVIYNLQGLPNETIHDKEVYSAVLF